MRVFVAGTSGVIGKQLVPFSVEDGHEAVRMTLSSDIAELIHCSAPEAGGRGGR